MNAAASTLFNGDIQSKISWQWLHQFQNVCIPGCLLTFLNRGLYDTDIQVQKKNYNRSSTMLEQMSLISFNGIEYNKNSDNLM